MKRGCWSVASDEAADVSARFFWRAARGKEQWLNTLSPMGAPSSECNWPRAGTRSRGGDCEYESCLAVLGLVWDGLSLTSTSRQEELWTVRAETNRRNRN